MRTYQEHVNSDRNGESSSTSIDLYLGRPGDRGPFFHFGPDESQGAFMEAMVLGLVAIYERLAAVLS